MVFKWFKKKKKEESKQPDPIDSPRVDSPRVDSPRVESQKAESKKDFLKDPDVPENDLDSDLKTSMKHPDSIPDAEMSNSNLTAPKIPETSDHEDGSHENILNNSDIRPSSDLKEDKEETGKHTLMSGSVTSGKSQEKPRSGFFSKLKNGLSRTRNFLNTDIEDLFKGNRKVDDTLLEELEELLITSDLGVSTVMNLMESITKKASKIHNAKELKEILKEEILQIIKFDDSDHHKKLTKPHVIMVIGVNGVGKTTTIGKLAARYSEKGYKVLIAAADTFRAAAVEQLSIWAERSGSQFVHHRENADPAAVAYDGVEAAIARDIDVVLIDTAGRLHTQVNLMEELKKIKRSISKKIPTAPHEILIVVDATTGQNALSQAKLFNDAIDITGIALTKLDGTAKGGIAVSICDSLKIPLKFIGVGEQIDDLQEFNPEEFIGALL